MTEGKRVNEHIKQKTVHDGFDAILFYGFSLNNQPKQAENKLG